MTRIKIPTPSPTASLFYIAFVIVWGGLSVTLVVALIRFLWSH